MTRLRILFLMAAVLLVTPASAGPKGPKDSKGLSKTLPKAKDFRRALLGVMKSYPTNGKHLYYWPKGKAAKGWKGTTCDLVYDGQTVAKGDSKGRCYCCGLTFEVFFRAYKKWAKSKSKPFKIGDLDAKGVNKLIRAWFGANGDRRCSLGAIVDNKLGVHIKALKDAKAGDFVQLWRHNKSGHSVVFVNWVRDENKAIVGLKYWSTQKSTKGVGTRVERFGPKGLKRDEIYIARVGRP